MEENNIALWHSLSLSSVTWEP